MLRKRLKPPAWSAWNAALIAAAAGYLVVVIAVALALPGVNEVPEQFRPLCVAVQGPFRLARN